MTDAREESRNKFNMTDAREESRNVYNMTDAREESNPTPIKRSHTSYIKTI